MMEKMPDNVRRLDQAKRKPQEGLPAKAPGPKPDKTEFFSFAKALGKKEEKTLAPDLKAAEEQIRRLEEDYAELDQQYTEALAEKDPTSRKIDSLIIFERMKTVAEEITRRKAEIISTKDGLREIKRARGEEDEESEQEEAEQSAN